MKTYDHAPLCARSKGSIGSPFIGELQPTGSNLGGCRDFPHLKMLEYEQYGWIMLVYIMKAIPSDRACHYCAYCTHMLWQTSNVGTKLTQNEFFSREKCS